MFVTANKLPSKLPASPPKPNTFVPLPRANIDCQFRESCVCRIASTVAGKDVTTTDRECRACVSLPSPRNVNPVTVSLAIAAVRGDVIKTRELLQLLKPNEVRETAPPFVIRVWNFASAVASYVASGLQNTTAKQFEDRLSICRDCPQLEAADMKCLVCGCSVLGKARMVGESCPKLYWPIIK